jgi:hypothetical protein
MRAYSFRAALNAGLEPRDYKEEPPIDTLQNTTAADGLVVWF